MAGVNKWIGIGFVGNDPTIRNLENGTKVANFSIAISEKWTDKNTGEIHENTEWVNIVVWRKLAEIVEKYIKKGSQVYIEGKLQTRSWEKDGIKRYSTDIVANNLTMLGGGNQPASAPQQASPQASINNAQEAELDDLPF